MRSTKVVDTVLTELPLELRDVAFAQECLRQGLSVGEVVYAHAKKVNLMLLIQAHRQGVTLAELLEAIADQDTCPVGFYLTYRQHPECSHIFLSKVRELKGDRNQACKAVRLGAKAQEVLAFLELGGQDLEVYCDALSLGIVHREMMEVVSVGMNLRTYWVVRRAGSGRTHEEVMDVFYSGVDLMRYEALESWLISHDELMVVLVSGIDAQVYRDSRLTGESHDYLMQRLSITASDESLTEVAVVRKGRLGLHF